MTLSTTVVSYPDRGPYGDSTYRGNCSGYLIGDLIETFQPNFVFDPMMGGGTTTDVCKHLGVASLALDLKPPDPFDILDFFNQKQAAKLISESTDGKGADLIFFHPPYWKMIQYSLDIKDFSNGTYSMYLQRMARAIQWLSKQLSGVGHIAVLLGDLRASNTTYFLSDDSMSLSTLAAARLKRHSRIIKVQHNTMSGGDVGQDYLWAHEICTILEPVSPY